MEEIFSNIADSMVAARSRALRMDVPSTLQVFPAFTQEWVPKGCCITSGGVSQGGKNPVLTPVKDDIVMAESNSEGNITCTEMSDDSHRLFSAVQASVDSRMHTVGAVPALLGKE